MANGHMVLELSTKHTCFNSFNAASCRSVWPPPIHCPVSAEQQKGHARDVTGSSRPARSITEGAVRKEGCHI